MVEDTSQNLPNSGPRPDRTPCTESVMPGNKKRCYVGRLPTRFVSVLCFRVGKKGISRLPRFVGGLSQLRIPFPLTSSVEDISGLTNSYEQLLFEPTKQAPKPTNEVALPSKR